VDFLTKKKKEKELRERTWLVQQGVHELVSRDLVSEGEEHVGAILQEQLNAL